MAVQLQLRRGTTAENDLFVGAVAEPTMDTTLNELRIHDGSTVGGHKIAKADLDNLTNDGKNVCATLPLPSATYTNVTLGASGTTYTMTDTGWLSLYVSQPGTYHYQFQLMNQTRGDFRSRVYQAVNDFCVYIPVIKGDVVHIEYSSFPANYQLRLYKSLGIN